jgi:hypothetical protein
MARSHVNVAMTTTPSIAEPATTELSQCTHAGPTAKSFSSSSIDALATAITDVSANRRRSVCEVRAAWDPTLGGSATGVLMAQECLRELMGAQGQPMKIL